MIANVPFRRPLTVADEVLEARCARGRVVLIDDDPEILAALSMLISMDGYSCESYDSAQAYLQVLDLNRPATTAVISSVCH